MEKLKEKCAVFGVYGVGLDVARLTFYGLYALQHRGQESSGIATSNGRELQCYKGAGLVTQIYTEEKIANLPGFIAIGHNRYSTSAGTGATHAQPIFAGNSIGLVHNGNLPSVALLNNFLQSNGVNPQDKSDSELIATAVGFLVASGKSVADAVRQLFPLMTGVFSLLIMSKTELVAVRDSYGVRPLSIGKLNGGYVFASETCAFDAIGAEFTCDVNPGEMVVVDSAGLRSETLAPAQQKLDIFEFIYFARPDSVLLGKSVYEVRRNFGTELANEYPVAADIVVPVPETGIPTAIGYAARSGIPLELGLIKNRYVHRTFIQPEQHIRDLGVKMKLNPLRPVLQGKRVVLIDDSVVRGTTSRQIIKALFHVGATEVHFLLCCPPIRFPDFYGIDTPNQKTLLAFQKSVPQMCEFLGATSLHFLSYSAMIRATGLPEHVFCTSVFNGNYPVPLYERVNDVSIQVLPEPDLVTSFIAKN